MTEPFAKLRMALFCYGIVYFIVWNYVFYYVVACAIHLQPTYSIIKPTSKPLLHSSAMLDSSTPKNTSAPSIPSNAKPSTPCLMVFDDGTKLNAHS